MKQKYRLVKVDSHCSSCLDLRAIFYDWDYWQQGMLMMSAFCQFHHCLKLFFRLSLLSGVSATDNFYHPTLAMPQSRNSYFGKKWQVQSPAWYTPWLHSALLFLMHFGVTSIWWSWQGVCQVCTKYQGEKILQYGMQHFNPTTHCMLHYSSPLVSPTCLRRSSWARWTVTGSASEALHTERHFFKLHIIIFLSVPVLLLRCSTRPKVLHTWRLAKV